MQVMLWLRLRCAWPLPVAGRNKVAQGAVSAGGWFWRGPRLQKCWWRRGLMQEAAARSLRRGLERLRPLAKNKTLRYGVPMMLLIIGGSFGLREFTQIRYDAQKLHSKTYPLRVALVSLREIEGPSPPSLPAYLKLVLKLAGKIFAVIISCFCKAYLECKPSSGEQVVDGSSFGRKNQKE
ncbi:cytochrome c oxidase assembly protein COX16 homolog, mitochondrial [Eretmochelys imbricata]